MKGVRFAFWYLQLILVWAPFLFSCPRLLHQHVYFLSVLLTKDYDSTSFAQHLILNVRCLWHEMWENLSPQASDIAHQSCNNSAFCSWEILSQSINMFLFYHHTGYQFEWMPSVPWILPHVNVSLNSLPSDTLKPHWWN